jgi:antitoxin component of RelBE/YafQ-DinJ toxin-antitoxin module
MQRNVKVAFLAAPDLRAEAVAVADEIGVPFAEYMRMAMIHLVKTRSVPFSQRSDVKMGRPSKEMVA